MLSPALRLMFFGLLLASLAACDPRTEEEASSIPAQEMSPEDIIRAVLDAEKGIDSIRIDTTAIKEQRGHHEESTDFEIRVGDDHYSKTVTRGPSFRETACDFVGPEKCAEQLAYCEEWADCDEPHIDEYESLYFRGEFYDRDAESGRWTTPNASEMVDVLVGEDGPGTGGYLEVEDTSNPGEWDYLFSDLYGFSIQPSTLRVLDEEVRDGRPAIRVSGDLWFPDNQEATDIAAELENHLRETIGQSGDLPEEFRESLEQIPNRHTGTFELWVDPDSFLVYRMESLFKGWRDDRLVSSERRSSNFSLFNEAALPGPLPE